MFRERKDPLGTGNLRYLCGTVKERSRSGNGTADISIASSDTLSNHLYLGAFSGPQAHAAFDRVVVGKKYIVLYKTYDRGANELVDIFELV